MVNIIFIIEISQKLFYEIVINLGKEGWQNGMDILSN